MQDLLDAFAHPDPFRPLQKLYFPQISKHLNDLRQHDNYLDFKLKHDAHDYSRNLFCLYYDGLIRDESRLMGWADMHYLGGAAPLNPPGAASAARPIAPNIGVPSATPSSFDEPAETVPRVIIAHVDRIEFSLYKRINSVARVAVIDPRTKKDWLTPAQYAEIMSRGRISCERYEDGLFYVNRENFTHDKMLINDLLKIVRNHTRGHLAPLDRVDKTKLTASQAAVIDVLRDSPIAFMTGGAGTGKTTVIMAILRAYAAAGMLDSVLTLCPTNMAIENIRKRLEENPLLGERISDDVSEVQDVLQPRLATIHALAYRREVSGGAHPCNTLIIFEEASMYDNILGQIIAKNHNNSCQCSYLFVGDPEQLPPVARSSVFRLMLACFPKQLTKLRENFRSGDIIVQNSTRIIDSRQVAEIPDEANERLGSLAPIVYLAELKTSTPGLRFEATGRDLKVTSRNPYQIHDYDETAAIDWTEPIREITAAAIAHNPAITPHEIEERIMFITYTNADVLMINAMIRDAMADPIAHLRSNTSSSSSPKRARSRSPKSDDGSGSDDDEEYGPNARDYRIYPVIRDGRIIGHWEWHIGDRCRSLMNERGKPGQPARIANGSIGYVVDFGADGYLEVEYRGNVIPIHYSKLWPAYCITVHNSQGQEWNNVVFCELSGEPLLRSLAYVAITRAKKRQYIIRRMIGWSRGLLPTQFLLTA